MRIFPHIDVVLKLHLDVRDEQVGHHILGYVEEQRGEEVIREERQL